MKKSLLILGFFTLMLCGCNGDLYVVTDEENMLDFVADPSFNEYCKLFDTNNDGILSTEEIAAVKVINLPGRGVNDVVSLEGIENFVNLTYLNCSDNLIASLDISANTKLVTLRCTGNKLTTLDLSKNTELEVLYCHSNPLQTLDVSLNTKLTTLSCTSNGLETLDLSHNPALTRVWCSDNKLATLDLSNNTELTHLYCYDNQLTTLDLSLNTKLAQLYCYSNRLSTLNISGCRLLTYLAAAANPFTAIYVWAGFDTANPDSEFSYLSVDNKSVFTVL